MIAVFTRLRSRYSQSARVETRDRVESERAVGGRRCPATTRERFTLVLTRVCGRRVQRRANGPPSVKSARNEQRRGKTTQNKRTARRPPATGGCVRERRAARDDGTARRPCFGDTQCKWFGRRAPQSTHTHTDTWPRDLRRRVGWGVRPECWSNGSELV